MSLTQWSDAGYTDVYMAQSGSSSEVFVTRLNTYNAVRNLNNNGYHDGARVDCIASGYATYNQLQTKQHEIRILSLGLGFT